MSTKKYIVSSLLLTALVFSVSTKASAESGDSDTTVRVNADTSVKVLPIDTNTSIGTSNKCQRVDADRSGKIDAKDFSAFEKLFSANNIAADMDGNRNLNANDFIAFQNTYASCTSRSSGGGGTPTVTGSGTSNGRVDDDKNKKSSSDSSSSDKSPTVTGSGTSNGRVDDDKSKKSENENEYEKELREIERAKGENKRVFGELNALSIRLEKLADLIEKRIAELSNQKVNVTEAKTSLASAKTHLGYAKNAINAAISMYNSTGPGGPQFGQSAIKQMAKIAKSELSLAKQDLKNATKALRIHDNSDDGQNPVISTACKKFDMSGDGKLTNADFAAFQAAFAKGAMIADADGNGTLNANDYIAFMNGYVGCVTPKSSDNSVKTNSATVDKSLKADVQ